MKYDKELISDEEYNNKWKTLEGTDSTLVNTEAWVSHLGGDRRAEITQAEQQKGKNLFFKMRIA